MFERRSLSGELAAIRAAHAPDVIILDVDSDFETLPPAAAEDLGLLVDALDPATYPAEWVPDDAPRPLRRYAGSAFTIGLPGDGTVTWTRQTDPPVVFCKARAEGTPDAFLDLLIAEALVQVGLDAPEAFLPFFADHYPDLDAAVPLDPASVYQIGAALYDGWLGLRTRPTFEAWAEEYPSLHDAWVDAGDRLRDRVAGLPGAVARGETEFPDATELACAAIKHGLDLPAPFAALDTAAYVDYGADYAVRWARKTFETLE
ncbi:hypothetical protein DU504_07300 [Haloplanus salinus]|jgi:hypothetical protein|uniref:Uncharacterized protein n=1 Tax=Haloplanus salinus TaxID=1126245 RepID=A0A368N988_9EURY|nr:hypothetical protein [Haloplanus salinus]RCU47122.1 hypothetical protein DU504_07300 [Haloplanus salinus]